MTNYSSDSKALRVDLPTENRRSALSFDLITDLAGIHGLAATWRELESRVTEPFNYFQTYEWCEAWFRRFGARSVNDDRPQARIFTASVEGRTILIWPMMLSKSSMGLNILTSLTEPHGQYCNVLAVSGEDANAAILACWEQMQALPRVDAIELYNIPVDSNLASVVLKDEDSIRPHDVSSIMDLTKFADWDEYNMSLSGANRRSRKRKRKKLEEFGPLGFAVHTSGTEDFDRVVATAMEMKAVWLQETGKASRALTMDGNNEFLASIPDSPDGSCRALVCELTAGGRMVAGELGYERKGHYIGYLGAFDWDLRHLSPGKLEMEQMLRWCFDNGIKWYDLLGNAGHYKADWSNTDILLFNHHVGLTVLGRARTELWLKRLRPALKNKIEAMPVEQRKALLSKFGGRYYAPQSGS